ncbi:MAG: Hpt domain-containing protein [Planctomycetota bacterium]
MSQESVESIVRGPTMIDSFSVSTRTRERSGSLEPIHAELPLDDEELKQIVAQFIDKLGCRLDGMQVALAQGDFASVEKEAHWLKGSGGTVGFPQFTSPASRLERAAGEGDDELASEILGEIRTIGGRLVKPTISDQSSMDTSNELPRVAERNDTSIACTLPLDDADFRHVAESFLNQLDDRLLIMLRFVQGQGFEDLINEAMWLGRAGDASGFPCFHPLAEQLLAAVNSRSIEGCQQALQRILETRQLIDLG